MRSADGTRRSQETDEESVLDTSTPLPLIRALDHECIRLQHVGMCNTGSLVFFPGRRRRSGVCYAAMDELVTGKTKDSSRLLIRCFSCKKRLAGKSLTGNQGSGTHNGEDRVVARETGPSRRRSFVFPVHGKGFRA